ncbi:HipA family kinase [Alcanivoracaceae bacterium MT1]
MKNANQKKIEPIAVADVVTLLGRVDEGRDGETYKADLLIRGGVTHSGYVKLTEDPRQIIAELAAAQVGRALDLHIPCPYVAILDTADLRPEFKSRFVGRGRMVCFASRQAGKRHYTLERAPLNGEWKHSLNSQFDMPGTISFDEFIANDDRHLGNIVYAPDRREFWLIDHGRALTGTYWNHWGLEDPEISVRNLLADESADKWDEAQRRNIIKSAESLVLRCSEIAMTDLDMDGHFAKIDPSTDRQEIINFLQGRLNHTVRLLCNRLGLGQLPLR